MASPGMLVEIFPLNPTAIPRITTYTLDTRGSCNTLSVGNKLAYVLNREMSANSNFWAFIENKLVARDQVPEEAINAIIETLRRNLPDIYNGLNFAKLIDTRLSTRGVAEFTARNIAGNMSDVIKGILDGEAVQMDTAIVKREWSCRGWDIHGTPSVSISVSSRMLHKKDLAAYIKTTRRSPEDLIDLVDMDVSDKFSGLKGRITDCVGTLGQHRERLLHITRNQRTIEALKNAPDDEIVVEVTANSNRLAYDYLAQNLNPIITLSNCERFGIKPFRVLDATKLTPQKRYRIVSEIAEKLRATGMPYSTTQGTKGSRAFLNAEAINFKPRLMFRGNKAHEYNSAKTMQYLQEYGVYRRSCKLPAGTPLRIGVVNAISNAVEIGATSKFLEAVRQLMARTNFDFNITDTERSDGSQHSTEMAINRLLDADDPPDILLGFLPDGASSADEDGDTQYNTFKSITVSRGIPSQVIHQKTLETYNTYALNNIAIGIIGKTGNIPFILADKLPYADIITGIDIARRKKETLQGSMSIAAAARIYLNTGELLRYSIQDVPIEGETLPANVLYRLFPASEFENKRVVIHRDGPFMQGEKATLKRWADQLRAKFYFVEVIKTSAPRIYGRDDDNRIQQPPEWTAFTASNTEAFLISYAPKPNSAYSNYGTPRPLHIRTDPPFSIHEALHSVLSMTLLHYGSIKHPRLPVTVHYADKLGEMLLRGIKPNNTEGTVPFWL